MASIGSGTGIQIHRRVGLGQMRHPLRQQTVFPGHPLYRRGGFLHHTGVEIRKFPGVIRLKDVLHPGDGLEQQVPVLRGGHSVQTGQKIFIHPLAQGFGRLGSLVEERPVIGRE